MAVHRSGASSEDHEEISIDLGHLLVTIDDFESLAKQIRTHTGETVLISFIGGHIDEAEDLRSLTEHELADIRIQSADIAVDLTHTSALYRGPKGIGQQIQKWTRSHRSPLPWRLRSKDLDGKMMLVTIAFLGIIYGLGYLFLAWMTELLQPIATLIQSALSIPAYSGSAPSAWYAVAFGLLYVLYISFTQLVSSSCTIIPLSRDEYRKDRAAHRRQVVTWTIATLAIAATLIATQIKK